MAEYVVLSVSVRLPETDLLFNDDWPGCLGARVRNFPGGRGARKLRQPLAMLELKLRQWAASGEDAHGQGQTKNSR